VLQVHYGSNSRSSIDISIEHSNARVNVSASHPCESCTQNDNNAQCKVDELSCSSSASPQAAATDSSSNPIATSSRIDRRQQRQILGLTAWQQQQKASRKKRQRRPAPGSIQFANGMKQRFIIDNDSCSDDDSDYEDCTDDNDVNGIDAECVN